MNRKEKSNYGKSSTTFKAMRVMDFGVFLSCGAELTLKKCEKASELMK